MKTYVTPELKRHLWRSTCYTHPAPAHSSGLSHNHGNYAMGSTALDQHCSPKLAKWQTNKENRKPSQGFRSTKAPGQGEVRSSHLLGFLLCILRTASRGQTGTVAEASLLPAPRPPHTQARCRVTVQGTGLRFTHLFLAPLLCLCTSQGVSFLVLEVHWTPLKCHKYLKGESNIVTHTDGYKLNTKQGESK